MEKIPENKEKLNLTTEEQSLLAETKEMVINIGMIKDSGQIIKKQSQIVNFGKQLKKEGFDPQKYRLWHALISSSPRDDNEFDTPDGDIEKFINSLK